MGSNADAVREVDPAPSKAGLWEDFVDIFYAPSSVFARRSDGKFGLALLFLVVVGAVLFFVTKNAMQPIFDAEFTRQTAAAMRKNRSNLLTVITGTILHSTSSTSRDADPLSPSLIASSGAVSHGIRGFDVVRESRRTGAAQVAEAEQCAERYEKDAQCRDLFPA